MSHSGNYSNNDRNDNRYHTAQSNNRRNTPFGGSAFDDLSEPEFDEAPAISSGHRFGRPSRSDLQTEFDYDQRLQQQQVFNRAQSNPNYQSPGVQSSYLGRHMTADRFIIQESHQNEWGEDFENYNDFEMVNNTNDINNSTSFPTDANYPSYAGHSSTHSSAVAFSSNTLSSHAKPSGVAVAALPSMTSLASRPSSSIRELPPKKEATPILPPSSPVEPPIPQTRINRRYMQYTKSPRQPNRTVAKKVKNARLKPGEDAMQVLKCPKCQTFLKVLKMAVFMECPTCSAVSPATSSSSSGSGSGNGIGIGIGISSNSFR